MACVFLMSFGCIVSISTAKLCDALFLFGKLEIAEKSQRQSELRLRPGKCYSHLDVNIIQSQIVGIWHTNFQSIVYNAQLECWPTLQLTHRLYVCVYVILK